ncbi:amino acid adenylation domain-containing protein [Salinarimonas sp.]|uniref:amino acid adenylation domain-containing protein n=1 Tax=Salinarimonas sp. TaxID=2766526 RepID=UPI0032D9A35C
MTNASSPASAAANQDADAAPPRVLPLSETQLGILYQSLAGESGAYVVALSVELEGSLDTDAFVAAWGAVLRRHPALRARFMWEGLPQPVQVIDASKTPEIVIEDVSARDRKTAEDAWRTALERAEAEAFDLESGPLVKVRLVRFANDLSRMVASFHHLVVDGWSLAIVMRDVMELYRRLERGSAAEVAEDGGYEAFVRAEAERDTTAARGFWMRYLAGHEHARRLPPSARGAVEHEGTIYGRVESVLSPAAFDRLSRACAAHGLTTSTVVSAAWGLVLALGDPAAGSIYGATISGRPPALPGVEDMVGLFIKTIPVRITPQRNRKTAEWLLELQVELARHREHEWVSLPSLQRDLGIAPGSALFDSILVFENYPVPTTERDDALQARDLRISERTHYPATVLVSMRSGLKAGIVHDRRILDDDAARDLLSRLLATIEMLSDAMEGPLEHVLLPEAERRRVVATFNATRDETIETAVRVDDLVLAQARRSPAATAVRCGTRSLAYAELEEAAQALAVRLSRAGVGRGAVVGVCLERCLELPAALLGILRAGAAYLPLDPELPPERLRFMARDAGCAAVVTTRALSGTAPEEGARLLLDQPESDPRAPRPADAGGGPLDPAYVIYTSGSTGRPKGVVVPHAGAVNRLVWMQRQYGLGPHDRVLQKTPLGFDVSVWELFAPLIAGAELVMARPGGHRDPGYLAEEIARSGVTVLHFVPSMLRQYAATAPARDGVRLVVASGEALGADQPAAAARCFPNAAVHNLYGPTEASIEVSWWACDPAATDPVPIGRPIANMRLYVLDAGGEPCPVGVVGELHIAGVGLAQGYLGRPGQTAERFLPDPFGPPGGRLYRTGDLARWRRDGALDYLGRNDDQVKIRGHRIELGEVEAALAAAPGVRAAAVAARPDPAGATRLVGYLVGETGAAALDRDAVRDHLRTRLPPAMIPPILHPVDALPLTPNGKLDRNALPEPDDKPTHGAAATAEGTPHVGVEAYVAAVWSEVLDRGPVSSSDDFFALGGHSLSATRVIAAVRFGFKIEVPLRSVFAYPRLRDFARHVEELLAARHGARLPPIEPVADLARRPPSHAERRLWFLHQLDDPGSAFHVPVLHRLHGVLDVSALAAAFDGLARRHQAFRTRYVEEDGDLVVHLHGRASWPLEIVDARTDAPEAVDARIRAFFEQRFDLSAGPLHRACLVRVGDEEHLLAICMHHIVADGWSLSVLAGELGEHLAAAASAASLPPRRAEIDYGDYAIWEARPEVRAQREAQLAFWERRLAGLERDIALPMAKSPASSERSYAGAREPVELPSWISAALAKLCRREGVTVHMALLAAFGAFLARMSGQPEVAIGYPVAGRTRRELESCVGLFLNTLTARVEIARDPAFLDLLHDVREQCLEALAHQDVPYDQVVERLATERAGAGEDLFRVMLVVQNAPVSMLSLPEIRCEPLPSRGAGAKHAITLEIGATEPRIAGIVEYRCDLFDRSAIRALWRSFQVMVEDLLADPERPVSRLETIAREDKILVEERAATELVDVPLVAEAVSTVARAHPTRVALVHDDVETTYGDLERRANRLANHLRALGCERGDLVGLHLAPSDDMVVALLGVFKAGAAFLPLDPAYPEERLVQMIADTDVRFVIRDETGPCVLNVAHVVETSDPGLRTAPDDDPGIALHPDDTAYVIFTSGSTGAPKGVAGTHRAVGTRLCWDVPGSASIGAVYAVKTTMNFIDCLWEIFAPLVRGDRTVLVDRAAQRDVVAFARLVARHGVTRIVLVPSFLEMLLELPEPELSVLRRLEYVVSSGEPLPSGLAKRFRSVLPEVRLLNVYGTSEFWDATWADIVEADGSDADCIGVPLRGVGIQLLDADMRPVPVGVPAEVYVGGWGLARGYVRSPKLTASRFVPDPSGKAPGARLYRTGDIARMRADGALVFVGRADRQVKIAGHRLELGEVESLLSDAPGVSRAVAVVREDGARRRLLAAYVTPRPGAAPDRDDLARLLARRLPPAIRPSVTVVARFPLTPSGKVQIDALPTPERSEPAERTPPGTRLEHAVAEIWREVLGVEDVSREDDFFALGGHSLQGTRVVARIRDRIGVEVPLQSIFEARTLADLAARIGGLPDASRTALALRPLPEPRDAASPLSQAQARLWFLGQLESVGAAYNVLSAVEMDGALDLDALDAALGDIVVRQETLRTCIIAVAGTPVQTVAPPGPVAARRVDLTDLDDAAAEEEVDRIVRQAGDARLDVENGHVCEFVVVRLRPDRHVLVTTLHHIAADAWSVGVFYRELGAFYAARASGREAALSPLPVSYRDFAAWQRGWLSGPVLEEQLAYWRTRLAGAPGTLALPTDRPRPAVQDYSGASVPLALGPELSAAVRALALRENATVFMVLLAGLQALLARWSGQWDLCVGTPVANRRDARLEGLIGFFSNTVALRGRLAPGMRFVDHLRETRERVLEAFTHQDLPFERLVEDIRPERDLARHPLFQVMLALQNVPFDGESVAGLVIRNRPAPFDYARFDIRIDLREAGDDVVGFVEYATALFDRETVERLSEGLTALLGEAAARPEAPVGSLAVMPERERRRVVATFNATRDETIETAVRVDDLVLAQARRSPAATAVRCGTRSLAYAELEEAARALAVRLSRAGVGRGAVVGVCLERCLELPAALLGILRAGAAYLPLDPELPPERLRFMARDAGCAAVVTTRALSGTAPEEGARLLLDEPESDPRAPRPADAGGGPLDPAYVIYTSGSTGRPKGVVVPHAGAVNRLVWMQRQYGLGPHDRVLQKTPLGFDVSVWELFAPLIAGAELVMARPGGHRDPGYLAEEIARSGVTVLHFVPSMLRQYAATAPARDGVRLVVASGEALGADQPAAAARCFPNAAVHNLYGPTEASVDVSWWACDPAATDPVPIGRPIANMRLYVLDAGGEPCPVGVVGELHIAGVGLAQGYLGRPGQTAERFLPDPFGPPGGRLYRTGDLARWRRDGALDYLGRNDDQVKIRGHRIELGEVEAALAAAPGVRAAAVAARPDPAGATRLVGYLVGETGARDVGETRRLLVDRWKAIYDQTYGRSADDPLNDFAGWTSSASGEPIPPDEMRAWLDGLLDLLDLGSHEHVLEVGCGNGLVLLRAAPLCASYVGSDISTVALRGLRTALEERGLDEKVRLLARPAHDLSRIDDRSLDVAILNSVVQYFPDVDYFSDIIAGLAEKVADGGRIVVADLVNFDLADALHASVVRSRLEGEESPETIEARVARRRREHLELMLAPSVFGHLRRAWPRVCAVELRLKPGREANELVKFRYDAVLHVGEGASGMPGAVAEPRSIPAGDDDVEAIVAHVRAARGAGPVRIQGVPDLRIADDLAYLRTLHDPSARAPYGIHPEDVRAAMAALGLPARLSPSQSRPGCFDVTAGAALVDDCPPSAEPAPSLGVTHPLEIVAAQALPTRVRQHLAGTCPSYLIPSRLVVLPDLPTTSNGKIDRAALARLDAPAEERSGYVPASTRLEQDIVEVWGEVLGVLRVGARDNFFALGGDSLRSLQVLAQLAQRGWHFTLEELFQHQTPETLARSYTELRDQSIEPPAPFALVSATDRAALPGGVEDAYPLSDLQLGMIYHTEYQRGSGVYHDVFSYRLRLRYDEAALRASLERIAARHSLLRTSFHLAGFSEPLQLVAPRIEPELACADLRELPPARQEDAVRRWRDAERLATFELTKPGLWRVAVHRLGDETFVFSLSFHHAIADGWSAAVLLTELARVYVATLSGTTPPLPEAAPGYAIQIALERRAIARDATRRFWRDQLAEAPPPDLPLTRSAAPTARSRVRVVDDALHRGLAEVARDLGMSLKTLLLAAHLHAMSHLYGRSRVATGLVTSIRPETEVGARMVGLFLNTVPLVVETRSASWREAIEATFAAEIAMLRHRRLSLARIQEAAGRQQLFDVFFNFVEFRAYRDLPFEDLDSRVDGLVEETNYALEVQFSRDPDGRRLVLKLNYDRGLIDDDLAERLERMLVASLDHLRADVDAAKPDLAGIDGGDDDVLRELNDTDLGFDDFQAAP